MTTIANSVWLATALLHRSNPHAVHVSKHCVANKSPNSERHRMLFETRRGRRRLFRYGDPFDVDRKQGKVRPEKRDVPPDYQPLVDWYDAVYSKQTLPSAAALISETESGSEALVSSAGAFVIPGHLRKELGIGEGTRLSIHRERDRLVLQPITDEIIRSLRGRYKGTPSLVEDREREHRVEKDRLAR
jgi:bifunctional DNA-binding transcriptional regulator/antitoxin component of YhaV-PrlF toxin-antitoxin module